MSAAKPDQQANPLLPIFGLKYKSELINDCAGMYLVMTCLN